MDEIIEMLEYIMEGDTRTLSDPESEDGHLYDAIYKVFSVCIEINGFCAESN